MGYATVDQIAGEFKDFTPTTITPVSIADIEGFIVDADAEINSLLSINYVTPIIGGSEALVLLKMVEVWLVKHRILDIIYVKTGQNKTEQTGGKSYRQMALDVLKNYVSGDSVLIGAVLVTSGSIGRFACGDAPLNVFDRSRNQW
jgi:hypothetical protein